MLVYRLTQVWDLSGLFLLPWVGCSQRLPLEQKKKMCMTTVAAARNPAVTWNDTLFFLWQRTKTQFLISQIYVCLSVVYTDDADLKVYYQLISRSTHPELSVTLSDQYDELGPTLGSLLTAVRFVHLLCWSKFWARKDFWCKHTSFKYGCFPLWLNNTAYMHLYCVFKVICDPWPQWPNWALTKGARDSHITSTTLKQIASAHMK